MRGAFGQVPASLPGRHRRGPLEPPGEAGEVLEATVVRESSGGTGLIARPGDVTLPGTPGGRDPAAGGTRSTRARRP